jgi:hypothetical protein
MLRSVAVIGPYGDSCPAALYAFAEALGRALPQHTNYVITGGLDGVMEAVSKGARACTPPATTVGILPGEDPAAANPYVDVPIPTGIGIARNRIVISSGAAVVALAGGAGTLSELAFAWQLSRPIICCTQFEGWARQLAGAAIDPRDRPATYAAESVAAIREALAAIEAAQA